MFRLGLFRIRAYTFGALSSFLSAIARGGLMFMLIIWLQGIWLPEHGYDFASTPLWAGIRMLPLTVGFLLAGPVSGFLSDRYGSRPFATGGMLGSAASFVLLALLPVDFAYPLFAAILLLMGLSMGAFASPNRAGVMNSLPAEHRGAGGGMNQTFQNSAQVLSIGIFFTLMIVGLSATLPHALLAGLTAHGVPAGDRGGRQPPAARLGAVRRLPRLQPGEGADRAARARAHPGPRRRHDQRPQLLPAPDRDPFRHGLHEAFAFAIAACLVAAVASWSRGGRVVAAETHAAPAEQAKPPIRPSGASPMAGPGRGERVAPNCGQTPLERNLA